MIQILSIHLQSYKRINILIFSFSIMINLQALEEKLDKVLEIETKEGLTTWLLQKRKQLRN
ncbi:hypothetical protein ACNQGB_08870 [Flavobacterium sp. XS1P32]